jgi:hypothetical protein
MLVRWREPVPVAAAFWGSAVADWPCPVGRTVVAEPPISVDSSPPPEYVIMLSHIKSASGIATEGTLIAAVVSLITAVVTAVITVSVAERRARRDFALQFAAERVARKL